MSKTNQINLFGEETDIKEKKGKKSTSKGRVYDPRNKLNNLTGAEWQFSTKTVISKIYPSNLQHKLRSQHGGQKPPELCADLIKIFTKENQTILDPLAGVGGSLLGAALVNRKAIGIELNNKWIDIYNQVCELENLTKFPVLHGDANDKLKEISKEICILMQWT